MYSMYRGIADLAKGFRVMLQILLPIALITGCSGLRTFHEVARAGDTVALAAGWQEDFSRDRLTVTIYPADNSPAIVLGPDNPAIRAVVNFYPDPISSIVVSNRTNQDISPSARNYGDTLTTGYTNNERDWWQTVVFVDLPGTLPVGTTDIELSDPQVGFAQSSVDIIAGSGSPNSFKSNGFGNLSRQQLAALERSSYYKVSFSGATLPQAIQIDFTHAPDVDNGGSGRAYATNPASGIKNLSWNDDGTNLRVIITPAESGLIQRFEDLKFYIAGGIQSLAQSSIQAFDLDGNPVAGVTATIDQNNIVLSSNYQTANTLMHRAYSLGNLL